MIAQLRGIISYMQSQQIVIDVQGVGYAVAVVDERMYSLNQNIDLVIYYHWNQENGPQLYGFETVFSRTIFSYIISCSGCGPKLGLAVLAKLSPHEFLQAIALADAKALSSVSGVGPKKAELMIMQLKDKVAKIAPGEMVSAQNTTLSKIKQLHGALSDLSYKQHEIAAALEYLNKHMAMDANSFDDLLRKALSFLAKK